MQTQTRQWQAVKNLVPLPYSRVSGKADFGPTTEDALADLLIGGEPYPRTVFIVLHNEEQQYAVVAITRAESEPLFSQITSVEVLALPDSSMFVERPDVDPANRSALAQAAHELGVGLRGTLILKGMYDHVNFIHHPDPL